MKKLLLALALALAACASTPATADDGRLRNDGHLDVSNSWGDAGSVEVVCDTKTGITIYVYVAYHGGGIAVDSGAPSCKQ